MVRKHIDMTEIPLRSMINYVAWSQHNWALCFHDYHRWTIKRLHNYSLCLTIPDSSKVRSPVSPCFNLVTDEPCLLVPCNCDLVSPSRTCKVMVTIPPSGPQSMYPSHGRTNPTIDQSHQPTPSRYSGWLHLYDRPFMVRWLMLQSYPSGGSW